jgi:hypothetical protein
VRARRLAAVGAVALLVTGVAACGGGDDDDVALEDVEPIVELSPCDLLDGGTASELSGAEVGEAEETVEDDGTVRCQFAFADGGVADTAGSSIAASLSIGPGDASDVPTGALARSLSIGEEAAVEEAPDKVRVVYVVREVVVRVEVVPGSGEVTPELVDDVVAFTETTEAPITEAVTGEPFVAGTTTSTAPTTAVPATQTTLDTTVQDLWSRNATEFRDRVGQQFTFECPTPAPAPQLLDSIWGTGTYTDDSAVCVAAVHSGRITLQRGGTVTIEMRPGQDFYTASGANGVTSLEYPAWPASFAVVGP